MNRRNALLVLLAFGTAPIAAKAQQQVKSRRIVILTSSKLDTKAEEDAFAIAFVAEMASAGFAMGSDYLVEVRALDDYERLPQGSELAVQNADIIIPVSPLATAFAHKATRTIPIVCVAVHDPVGMGYAASLARPGGNLTGVATFYAELIPKQLELVKSLLPKASRIAMLANSRIVGTDPAFSQKIRGAAQTLGIRLQEVPVSSPEQLAQAFGAMKRERADALIAVADEMFYVERRQIAELALRQKLPTLFATRENVEAGGLMSYGEDSLEKFAQAAKYVSKIMKGSKPGDLPIEQPTKFQLTINRKTAKALKLIIQQELILRADRLID